MTQISDAWFYRLKAAQRDLIKLAGQIERVAEITSISKSQVGRWNNTQDTDLIPLNAVLLLEAECGVPIVTAVMAELNGRRLADPDEAQKSTGTILARYAETVRQAGELMSAGAKAFADGKLTPAEAQQMDRVANDVERSLSDLRKLLAAARSPEAHIRVVEG
ncbi:hypothetical protein C5748_16240 [Phyllobacterium phragmitis]|uniref:Uncharacterized protein n=1 Tax=Phyllobacterium phragmitis TaxID=2670329 RepID=A0A2S9IPL3_9HYPH|nr:phage regulatory CII family protein [Phyllobacterium phragmitis]PRD42471.1 hypothetical protein C5748_16240 [Phyllobacterium phragmitis]